MNVLYKYANLIDGDYDGQRIHFNQKRYFLNYFIELSAYFFFLSHTFVFIFPDKKYDVVYYKIHDGFGDRIVNFFIGFTILSFGLIIPVHRKFIQNPKQIELISFIWCFDQKVMKQRYFLSDKFADKQIKAQISGMKYAKIWHRYFVVTIAIFIAKFYWQNPTEKMASFLSFN